MTIPFSNKWKHFTARKKFVLHLMKASVWFIMGAVVGFFFFSSFLYLTYKHLYTNRVYEGISIGGIHFGGKSSQEIKHYFAQKNKLLQKTTFIITNENTTATLSAREIGFGYDEALLAQQAIDLGRSNNMISNIWMMLSAYTTGLNIPPAFHCKEEVIDKRLALFSKDNVAPINAIFQFENGKVLTFRPSKDGKEADTEKVKKQIIDALRAITLSKTPQTIHFSVPMITKKPEITTDNVNTLGIKELLGKGTSLFHHSIANRIYNITLAASRLNGVLIKPEQTFSFTKTIGDISSLTGYKKAYVIENGKTVLGDGGGVCQVSTTLFRSALTAGLPIVERHAHAYRVGYYEQDSDPGIDAATYYPNVDLKFTNNTGHYILIQSFVDPVAQRLTFTLYGTSDDRQVTISDPIIHSQTPAPEPRYQDDPSLPQGKIKQIDFAAAGANVSFTRTVTKNGKTIDDDKFVSNYRPWQAVYLRGTGE